MAEDAGFFRTFFVCLLLFGVAPVMITGVPISAALKMAAALFVGRRMQPWDAAYPGRTPACIPSAPLNRRKYFMSAGLNLQPFGIGIEELAPFRTTAPDALLTIWP